MHASKGSSLIHTIGFQILEEEIPASLRSEVVVVSGPSHVQRRILITAASKDLEAARCVQELFSNHYFRLYTKYRCYREETAGAFENIIAVGAEPLHGLGYGDNAKQPSSRSESRALALSSELAH